MEQSRSKQQENYQLVKLDNERQTMIIILAIVIGFLFLYGPSLIASYRLKQETDKQEREQIVRAVTAAQQLDQRPTGEILISRGDH